VPAESETPLFPARPLSRSGFAAPRSRHWWLLASFFLVVLLPAAASTAYLYTRAANQYHSVTAFSIRSEQLSAAAAGILGAITQIGSGTASDINVLFDFIRSQRIVEIIDARLDLRRIYNLHPDDGYFSLGEDASIEDLLAYWRRMVTVDLTSAGIIEVRVNAFTPEDAHAIAEEILVESGKLVNQLSEQAHQDAVKFSREELALAESRLRKARQDIADFRRENRIIDPSGDVQGQVGIVNALQSELAKAMIERDMILSYADAKDQRVVQADRRIAAISGRIEAERDGMESGGVPNALPDVVGEYEALRTDLEIASRAYTHTLAGLAAAEAEARRQSRYLAPHIQPTMAQEPLYPKRATLAMLTAFFLLLGWSILVLVYYNIRDNNR
jgi:capsular polysaccharide transport system permease protein